MNNIKELIGKNVTALIEGEVEVSGKVIDVIIDSFYFEEKGEPIYITVNIASTEPLPEGVDYDDLNDIPLDYITKG